MNIIYLLLISWFPCALLLQAEAADPKLVYEAYDWDDNVVYMPSELPLFLKSSESSDVAGPGLPSTITISTSEFAEHKNEIGKSGKYAPYEIRHESYYRMNYDPTGQTNYFLEDVAKAVADPTKKWRGPSWNYFQKSMNDPIASRHVYVITARGNNRSDIFEGIRYLKQQGLIQYELPEENIWVVGHENFLQHYEQAFKDPAIKLERARGPDRSLQKLAVLTELIAQAQRNEEHSDQCIQFHFSDDDRGNIQRVAEGLDAIVGKMLTLHYTGAPKLLD